jgi:hypothetical protein
MIVEKFLPGVILLCIHTFGTSYGGIFIIIALLQNVANIIFAIQKLSTEPSLLKNAQFMHNLLGCFCGFIWLYTIYDPSFNQDDEPLGYKIGIAYIQIVWTSAVVLRG